MLFETVLQERHVGRLGVPARRSGGSRRAPFIDLGLRELLAPRDEPAPDCAGRDVHAALNAAEGDIAIVPDDSFPAGFATRLLREQRFVIALRRGHPDVVEP